MAALTTSDSETSIDPSTGTDDTSRCVLFSLADKESSFLSDVRDLVSQIEDLQVIVAPSMDEVETLLNDDVISLVVIDLHDPETQASGMELLKILEAGERVPLEYIPSRLVITPRRDVAARESACELGASDGISYPFRGRIAHNRLLAHLSAHNVHLMRRQIDLWRTRYTIAEWQLKQQQQSPDHPVGAASARRASKNMQTRTQQSASNPRRASDAFTYPSHTLSTSPSLLPVNIAQQQRTTRAKSGTASPTTDVSSPRRIPDGHSGTPRRSSFVLLPVSVSPDLEARFADLRCHRRDSMEFDMALRTVQQDMLSLKSRISDSFDSPMQHVVQLLAQLPKLESGSMGSTGSMGSNTRAVASTLRSILMDMYEALKTANLYEPDFNQLAENAGIDEETKEWLLNEYSSSGRNPNPLRLTRARSSASGTSLLSPSEPVLPTAGSAPPIDAMDCDGTVSSSASSSSVDSFSETESTTSQSGGEVEPPQSPIREPLDPLDVGEVAQLRSWNFDPFAYPEETLDSFVYDIFESFGILSTFNIPSEVFRKYVSLVHLSYKDTTYHNFRHAFDVMQTCYSLLCSSRILRTCLEPLDVFALLLSAMCHDVGHPGLNNVYQVNAQTRLALTYNDQSVLECMHTSLTFQLARDNEGANIFASLPLQTYMDLRKRIIQCILGTDMSFHFELLSKFKTLVASNLVNGQLTLENEDDLLLLLRMVLHSADIANPTKPWESAFLWASLLLDEFFKQGDEEQRLNLPVSPLMDREKIKLSRMSANFIDFVVDPLFESLLVIFPELRHTAYSNMKANRKRWNALCEEHTLLDLVSEVAEQRPEAASVTSSSSGHSVTFDLPPEGEERPQARSASSSSATTLSSSGKKDTPESRRFSAPDPSTVLADVRPASSSSKKRRYSTPMLTGRGADSDEEGEDADHSEAEEPEDDGGTKPMAESPRRQSSNSSSSSSSRCCFGTAANGVLFVRK
mmetsp:Transcript_10762/g.33025  ORF Transcript_10762/g.33025 Transcript_10762/m.33025 type:complete len:972 (-) Transcript_10762:1208-4123(-)